jgi:hypothetical protein
MIGSVSGIGMIFEADKERQDIQAQTKITQEFSKQASTAIASYSTTQKQSVQGQIKKASDAEKPALKQQLDQVLLEEKVLNILVRAVTGFGQTAVTKESLAVAADEMRALMVKTGCVQGYKGTLFDEPYNAGSWQDKLIGSFAGTHDMIGGKLSGGVYDSQGGIPPNL